MRQATLRSRFKKQIDISLGIIFTLSAVLAALGFGFFVVWLVVVLWS